KARCTAGGHSSGPAETASIVTAYLPGLARERTGLRRSRPSTPGVSCRREILRRPNRRSARRLGRYCVCCTPGLYFSVTSKVERQSGREPTFLLREKSAGRQRCPPRNGGKAAPRAAGPWGDGDGP